MTNSPRSNKNTSAFFAQSAISFGVALFAVCLGIAYLPVSAWMRAFLALGALYLVTSSFTLAKVIRDQQEQGTVISRLDEARLERLLAEYDPYRVPTTGPMNAAPFGPTPAGGPQAPQAPQYPMPQAV